MKHESAEENDFLLCVSEYLWKIGLWFVAGAETVDQLAQRWKRGCQELNFPGPPWPVEVSEAFRAAPRGPVFNRFVSAATDLMSDEPAQIWGTASLIMSEELRVWERQFFPCNSRQSRVRKKNERQTYNNSFGREPALFPTATYGKHP